MITVIALRAVDLRVIPVMIFLEPMEYLISLIGLKLPKHSWKDHKPMPIAAE